MCHASEVVDCKGCLQLSERAVPAIVVCPTLRHARKGARWTDSAPVVIGYKVRSIVCILHVALPKPNMFQCRLLAIQKLLCHHVNEYMTSIRPAANVACLAGLLNLSAVLLFRTVQHIY